MSAREGELDNGFAPCPDSVAVIGGGRWARVLIEVLCQVTPTVGISVHSVHNANPMQAWALNHGLGKRVHVSAKWPRFDSRKSSAVIVVNAARDHERAVEWALSNGVPALVEKPIALTAAAARRLAKLARSRKVYLAAANIFLFARYTENFANLVAEARGVRCLRVRWMDPESESRYGEQKQYDASLPVFADWLPHVSSLVGTLTHGQPQKCVKLALSKGGGHLELELMLGNVPCSVQLVRNGDRRQRIIEVCTEREVIQLDFSKEPGIITYASKTVNGDPDWEVEKRPAARMLAAFLEGAAGGHRDHRLDIEIGIQANQVIDATARLYGPALMSWLTARLAACRGEIDGDLRYALSEILQADAFLPADEMERQIEHVRQHCSRATDTRWLRALAGASDPSRILRSN